MGKGSLIDQACLVWYMHCCPIVRSRWPDIGQVFVCIFMGQEEVKTNKTVKEKNKTKQKKNEANIQPSWLNKLCQYIILYLAKEWTSCGTDAGKPEQARWAHLACSGSQSEHRIRFLLSTRRFNHIIMHVICI